VERFRGCVKNIKDVDKCKITINGSIITFIVISMIYSLIWIVRKIIQNNKTKFED